MILSSESINACCKKKDKKKNTPELSQKSKEGYQAPFLHLKG